MKQAKRVLKASLITGSVGLVLIGGLLALNNPSPSEFVEQVLAVGRGGATTPVAQQSPWEAMGEEMAKSMLTRNLQRTNLLVCSIYRLPGEPGALLAIGGRVVRLQ